MVNLDGSGCCYFPIFSFGFFCEVRIGATMYFANVAYVEDTLRTLIEETWFWSRGVFLSLVKFHDRLLVRTSLRVISIESLIFCWKFILVDVQKRQQDIMSKE